MTPSWHITSATVTGTRHLDSGTTSQDAHTTITRNHNVILAAADGAGSAPYSATGALLASHVAAAALAGALNGPNPTNSTIKRALNTAFHTARQAIQEHAAQQGHHTSEYATTLLLAVLTQSHLGTLQIGDGAIVSQNANNQLTVHTRQQEREFVNEVVFLTCDQYANELNITVKRQSQERALFVFTDGVENLCIHRHNNTAHPGFFNNLTNAATNRQELIAFLTSPRVRERVDDDETLIIATRQGA